MPVRSLVLSLFLSSVWGCNAQESTAPPADDRLPFSERTAIYPAGGTLQHVTLPPLPDTLTFAGETVPLDRDDVREGVEYELIVNMYWHSHTLFVLRNIERWRPLIEKTLTEQNVPADFIYLAVAESELRNTARSPAGAVGMWQFMPLTARDYGLVIDDDVDMRRDPERATEAACRYLKWAHARLENWPLVAASYNSGLSGVQRLLKAQQIDTFWDLHTNPETARYLYRIIAFKLILENPEAYGYFLRPEDTFQPHPSKTVTITQKTDLIALAKENNTTYKALRELNPWLSNTSTYTLTAPRGGLYKLKVPVETGDK